MASASARKLKRLLVARDPALVTQGVELAIALGDGAVIDELLEGVTYDPGAKPQRPRWMRDHGDPTRGRLVLPTALAPSERQRVFSELGVLGLISHGRGERAAALRDAITSLVIEHEDDHAPEVVDAWLLSGLTSLSRLRLAPRRVARVGALGALPALAELDVGRGWSGSIEGELTGLGRAPKLRVLVVRGRGLTRLAGLEGADLERLELGSSDLSDLGALASVRARHVRLTEGAAADLSPLARMETLDVLELGHLQKVATLASLTGARCRRIELAAAQVDELAISGLPLLESVTGRGDAMKRVTIRDVPALRQLRVSARGPLRVDALDAPALAELTLGASPLTFGSPPNVPSLVEASLSGVTDEAPLSSLANVRQLALSGGLTTLAPIRSLPALRSLRLSCTASLTRLEDMPEVRPEPEPEGQQPALSLAGHAALRSLEGIGRYHGLTKLSLERATALESLRGIEGLESLRELDLRDCTALTSLEGLSALQNLRVLDLRGCSALVDVAPLGDLRELRVIAIHRSSLQKHQLPDAVAWAVTEAMDPSIERLAQRELPKRARTKSKRRTPVAPELLEAWDRTIACLRRPRLSGLTEAIASIEGCAEPSTLLEKLLDGTTYAHPWLAPGPSLKSAIGGDGSDAAFAAVRLLAEVDAHTPALDALREKVTALRQYRLHRVSAHFDLRWAARFPSLTWLEPGPYVTHPEGLGGARALAQLALVDLSDRPDLGFLRGATALRQLHISKAPPSLAGAGALPHLERLSAGGVTDLGNLDGCASLRQLSLSLAAACDLSPLAALSELTALTLTVPHGVDLSPLASLPNLSALTLRTQDELELGALSRLRELRFLDLSDAIIGTLPPLPPTLRALRVGGARLTSLGELAGLPDLRALTLRRVTGLPTLGPLPASLRRLYASELAPTIDLSPIGASRLEIVIIETAAGVSDLEPFAGAPTLFELALTYCAVADVGAAKRIPALARLKIESNRGAFDPTPLAEHPRLQCLRTTGKSLSARPPFVRELMRSPGAFTWAHSIEEICLD